MNALPAPYRSWTPLQLFNKFQFAVRGRKYAWAMYYRATNDAHDQDHLQHQVLERVVAEDSIPTHIKTELKTMATQLKKKWECPVCLEFIPDGNLEITNCGHFFCKPCLTQIKQTAVLAHEDKWSCAVCRKKHAHSDD